MRTLAEWLESEEGQVRLAEARVYRVHVGEDERHYVMHHGDILDEGCPGLRFSFCGPRQVWCYNALVRVEDGVWVLKVIASAGPDKSYRGTFGPIRGVEDVFEALAFKLKPYKTMRDESLNEQLQGDIQGLERRVGHIEFLVAEEQDQIMKRALMVLDGRLPADLVPLVFARNPRAPRPFGF
jgi:hypothetical protein